MRHAQCPHFTCSCSKSNNKMAPHHQTLLPNIQETPRHLREPLAEGLIKQHQETPNEREIKINLLKEGSKRQSEGAGMGRKSHFEQYSSFCKQEGKEDFPLQPATVTDVQYRLRVVVRRKYSNGCQNVKETTDLWLVACQISCECGQEPTIHLQN